MVSSGHRWDDPRIFYKESLTLVRAGYPVHVVSRGKPELEVSGVEFHPVPTFSNRWRRFLLGSWSAFRLARDTDAKIVHLHDFELILFGLLLKAGGRTVVFDAHEEMPAQVLGKPWIPAALRRPTAWLVGAFERLAYRFFDAVVAATPRIERRLQGVGLTVIVRNFPRLEEFAESPQQDRRKGDRICYVGLISKVRGALEMVRAVGQTRGELALAGPFESEVLRECCRAEPGWERVREMGRLRRQGTLELLNSGSIGLCLFHPLPNHMEAMPTKVFEYMAAGLAVVVSDLPGMRRIVEESRAGLVVDPRNVEEIAAAIEHLVDHPEEAESMGRNGRQAVLDRFNWESEAATLLKLYGTLGGSSTET